MAAWICATCGMQYPDTAEPPAQCPICQDERQYVGADGQRWTTMADLARDHAHDIRAEEPGLLGIGITPSFAIGQRAVLVSRPGGNVLWGCIPLLARGAIDAVRERGGISAISISHPHYYAAMVDWAETFGAPILLPTADREWVMRPSDRVEFFDDSVEPVPGVTIHRVGGHFAGSTVLHTTGEDGKGVLISDDTMTVVADNRWVSFMRSYPNLIPLSADAVRCIADRVAALDFDRIYGAWYGRQVPTDGNAAVRRSADRYIAYLTGKLPTDE
ncbi:MAG: hypothetical protein ACR2JQ_02540 [Mycobacteriales bacterium]